MSETLVISASQFKAQCLELFDRLAARKLDQITVTKRGKPVAELRPPQSDEQPVSLYGAMKGRVILPPGVDWSTADFSIGDLVGVPNAERGILLEEPMPFDDEFPEHEA